MVTSIDQTVAEEDHSEAVGRTEITDARVDGDRVLALAATLDLDAGPGISEPLPPGWHWIFFNPFLRRRDLGVDGHPKRGSFMPDIKLPRRMWAGGRLRYHAPLPIGADARRSSEIASVSSKTGRAGKLVFVTVRHRITVDGTLCIEEEQDIVYREAPVPGVASPQPKPAPEGAEWTEQVEPDPVLLFRYSALTSNGHRIHYDRHYAQHEEGYRDLVVHGPLTATLLQNLAARCRPEAHLSRFAFRGVAPLFVDGPFRIEAAWQGAALDLWARGPRGELAMSAEAEFRDRSTS